MVFGFVRLEGVSAPGIADLRSKGFVFFPYSRRRTDYVNAKGEAFGRITAGSLKPIMWNASRCATRRIGMAILGEMLLGTDQIATILCIALRRGQSKTQQTKSNRLGYSAHKKKQYVQPVVCVQNAKETSLSARVTGRCVRSNTK